MTFLTNPSFIAKKTPLIDGKCDEVIEISEAQPPWAGGGSRLSLLCLTLVAFLVTMASVVTGLMLYRQYLRTGVAPRYQGFCTIPITIKDPAAADPQYQSMMLHWSPEPEMQVMAIGDDESGAAARALREQLDIGDSVERISIMDNGRNVDFIHDFNINLTGIIDADRCFFMDLDPETVLAPEAFVLSIEAGGEFDVSHVRSTLRAALPALEQLGAAARDLRAGCEDKPAYRLLREEEPVIRKRGVDAPPHDYIQFAGRHVQEIQISNLADLLQREQADRK